LAREDSRGKRSDVLLRFKRHAQTGVDSPYPSFGKVRIRKRKKHAHTQGEGPGEKFFKRATTIIQNRLGGGKTCWGAKTTQ